MRTENPPRCALPSWRSAAPRPPILAAGRQRTTPAGRAARAWKRGCRFGEAGVFILLSLVAAAAPAATIRHIHPILTPDSTRLVIELSAPAAYRLVPVEGRRDLGTPDRLHVEILDSEVDPHRATLNFSQGPVVRVRGAQASGHIARLILDVPGMTAFGAFWMNDPFRLIVDARGTTRHGSMLRPTLTPAPSATPSARRAQIAQPTQTPRLVAPAPKPQRRFKIVIDPGHGGKDAGAVGVGGVAEKDVVLSIALLLKSRLASAPDIDVVLTRHTDIFVPLEERTARANVEEADLFISIHANASTNAEAHGVETYYLNNTNDRATLRLAAMENGLRGAVGQAMESDEASLILSDLIQNFKIQESVQLAKIVQQSLIDELEERGTPTQDLGVKRGPFFVLVGAGMPGILAEVSFVSHATEGARLARRSYQETIADGLLRGVRQFVENAAATGNL